MRKLLTSLIIAGLGLALSACNLEGAQPSPSPTPELPVVEFLFPENGSTVLEDTDLQVDLVARDAGVGIARIEFLVDGAKVNEAIPQDGVTAPVFRVNMNWLAKGTGFHALSATAYRLDGTASDEATIVIEVLLRE